MQNCEKTPCQNTNLWNLVKRASAGSPFSTDPASSTWHLAPPSSGSWGLRFSKVLADHHLLFLLGHHLPLGEEDLEVEEEDEDQGDEEGAQGGVHDVSCHKLSVLVVKSMPKSVKGFQKRKKYMPPISKRNLQMWRHFLKLGSQAVLKRVDSNSLTLKSCFWPPSILHHWKAMDLTFL